VVSVADERGGRVRRRPPRSRRQRRLGQNFLADPNLLDAIVADARVGSDDVVLEVGGGEGALSERLAPRIDRLHVVELDERLREPLADVAARHPNVEVIWADALRIDLGALDPAPTALVSNLPYAIATPLIVRAIEEVPTLASLTILVQREIADRLRAKPGTREYGAPSVLVQFACDLELARTVDRAVFVPRPRVDSALLRLERRRPAAPEQVKRVVQAAFAHRRKALAGSLELAGVASREHARDALERLGIGGDARAEALTPEQFAELAKEIER
jgi:16S rRNA (adenine1518-N6/adenine1519-N6)-dimethyltransferase